MHVHVCMIADGSVPVTDGYNPEDPALSSASKSDFLPVPLMLPMGPRFGTLPPPIHGMIMSRKQIIIQMYCVACSFVSVNFDSIKEWIVLAT